MNRPALPAERALLALAYGALAVYGLWLREDGLDPASFWNDDSWLAIVIRQMSWGDYFRLRPPVPIGFRWIQGLVSSPFGDPEYPLQLVPVAASVLLALLAGGVAARLCGERWIGPVAAAWALVAPVWIELGAAPKQYATDGLVTVGLLFLAVTLWQQPGPARVLAFLGGCVGALALSFPAAFTIAPAIAVTLLLPATRRVLLDRRLRWPVAATGAALLALVGFMQTQSGGSLQAYWSKQGAFLPTDSLAEAWRFALRFGADAATGGFPVALPLLGLGVIAGLLTLARNRLGRATLALVAGIYAAILVGSALAVYPAQSERMAAFHRPLGPIVLAVGIYGALHWLPSRARRVGFVLAALAALPFAQRSVYRFDTRDGEAVRAVNERLRPDDTVITYLRSAHALAYYSPGPHAMVAEPRLGCGFVARLKRRDVHYLWLGSDDAPVGRAEVDAQLSAALAGATNRIVYVPPRSGTRAVWAYDRHARSQIEAAGHRPSAQESSSYVLVYE